MCPPIPPGISAHDDPTNVLAVGWGVGSEFVLSAADDLRGNLAKMLNSNLAALF